MVSPIRVLTVVLTALALAGCKNPGAAERADAARQDHDAASRRYEDGQETMSVVLDKLAVRDEAEMRLAQAIYASALADVMLRQAVGLEVLEGNMP